MPSKRSHPRDVIGEDAPLTHGRTNLLDLSLPELEDRFPDTRYRGSQIYAWVFAKGVRDISAMTNIPRDLRAALARSAEIAYPKVVGRQVSEDGTEKLAYELKDGLVVESVLIPEKDHWSVCVSSQVGCAMGCRFCFTATMGFTRHLTSGEILSQVLHPVHAYPDRDIRNVVFMGMGEPLLNYANVIKAASIMTDPQALMISKRRVTISTCGIVPALKDLSRDTDSGLAVSLNAADDETRSSIMPVNRKYPMAQLIRALKDYELPHRRRITVEYVLLKGINDSVDDARRLVKVLHGLKAKINLIPFNPWPGCTLQAPDPKNVLAFEERLKESPFTVMLRKEKGKDILAACGQLAGGKVHGTRDTH
jgi:23S rRNA (adenine2503-C2)-methyltransferase